MSRLGGFGDARSRRLADAAERAVALRSVWRARTTTTRTADGLTAANAGECSPETQQHSAVLSAASGVTSGTRIRSTGAPGRVVRAHPGESAERSVQEIAQDETGRPDLEVADARPDRVPGVQLDPGADPDKVGLVAIDVVDQLTAAAVDLPEFIPVHADRRA